MVSVLAPLLGTVRPGTAVSTLVVSEMVPVPPLVPMGWLYATFSVSAGNVTGLMLPGGLAVRVGGVLGGGPAASVMLSVKVAVPAAPGVPLMVNVPALLFGVTAVEVSPVPPALKPVTEKVANGVV